MLAMDANQTPWELGNWAGEMLEKAGGAIVAPKSPTHYLAEGGGPRIVDYFLMSSSVAMVVGVCEVAEEFGCAPHKVVRVKLRSDKKPGVDPQNEAAQGLRGAEASGMREEAMHG